MTYEQLRTLGEVFLVGMASLVFSVAVVWLLARMPSIVPPQHISFLVAVIVAVVGWYAASVRDAENKRREMRVQYLVDAYRKIESISARSATITRTAEQTQAVEKLESALADLQLFGDARQRDLVKGMIREIESARYADPRQLLVVLRNDMRSALNLPPAPDDPKDILHFRVRPDAGSAPREATPR